MSFYTDTLDFTKVCTANAADASFPSRVATATEPTGSGVVQAKVSGRSFSNGLFVFYGTGADDTTYDARVIGWRKVGTLWLPVPLVQVAVTLGAAVGVAGQSVLATERFADTLALATDFSGAANVSVQVQSLGTLGDLIAHLILDLKGFTKFEVIFDMGTATDGNALWAGY